MMIGLSTISIRKVRQISANLSQVNDVNSVKQRYAINFRGSVHDRAIALRDVSLVSAPNELDAAVADIERLAENYAKSAGPLDAMLASGTNVTPEERAIVVSIKATEARTMPIIARVITLRREGQADAAHALLLADARPQFTVWLKQINEFIDLQEAKNKAVGLQTAELAGSFTWLTIGLSLIALVLGTGAAMWATRSIRPLRELTTVMGTLAEGDLTVDVPSADRGDEIGEIARAVNSFKESGLERIRAEADARRTQTEMDAKLKASEAAFLAEQKHVVDTMAGALSRLAEGDLTVRLDTNTGSSYVTLLSDFNTAVANLATQLASVDQSAEQVSAAGSEITSGSQALAQGASEQAASLEQVAAKVQLFASMAQQSAGNAKEARQLAATAHAHTMEGTSRMDRLTDAVRDIRAASVETAKIVKTIEEIAFQTNLLALNAAVEAARAGDAGRGFAVVAEEVRALALRSSEASKTTAALIERNVVSAQHGVTLNAEVLQSLQQINVQVQRVAEVTDEISTAAAQQAEGVSQINAAVEQMNGLTQQVAANAEESASAAAELESQARGLRATVGTFVLSSGNDVETVRMGSRGRSAVKHSPMSVGRVATRAASRSVGARPIMPRPAHSGSDMEESDDEALFALSSF